MAEHILVVDDDTNVSGNLKELLETVGYSVTIANSSEQALQCAEQSSPDLILMDINLGPGPDGIETAKKLNGKFQGSLIYLSGSDDDACLERAQATNPLSYVLKPFETRQLLSTVKMGVYHKRTHPAESAEPPAPVSAPAPEKPAPAKPAPEKPAQEIAAQDSLTGLATKSMACSYMLEAIEQGKAVCATVFVVDRYTYVRNRYGRQVGDEVISLFSLHLAQYLPSGSTLFRWDGPAFVAVAIEADLTGARYHRNRITMMTRPPNPYYLQQQSRTALIPIGSNWSTYFSSPQEKPTDVIEKIDSFVEANYRPEEMG